MLFHKARKTQEAKAYYNRGERAHQQGDGDQEIADLSQEIELNPQDVNAYITRGNAYFDKGDYDQAIEDFNHFIELNRGLANHRKEDYDRAIADYNQAIEVDLQHAWAYYQRGCIYSDQKRWNQACADWEKAVALDPDGKFGQEANKKLQALKEKGND